MAQTVIGMFDSAAEAQQAVQQLVSRGFSRDNIDVTNRSSDSSTSGYSDTNDEESGIGKFFKNLFSDDDDDSNKYSHVASRSGSVVTVHAQSADQAEEAADILDDAGAVDVDEKASQYGYSGSGASGAGLSGTSGSSSFLGTDTSLNTPGLSGADSYGTTAASPVGAFDTGNLSNSATSGGVFGTSNADNSIGASSTGSDFGTSGTDNSIGSTGLSSGLNTTEGTQKVQVIEENLQVGKREVLTGGKRLRSRIVERPVEESLRLREENVTVHRTPVDRPATSADLANFEGTQIEMTETKEVPVVSKEARVVEEVSLGKEVEQRNETISDTVRKTEVDIENIEGSDSATRTGSDYNSLSDKNSF